MKKFILNNNLEKSATERLNQLILIKQNVQKQVKTAPNGTLRISKWKNLWQFYHLTDKSNKNGKYLSKKTQHDLIKQLAQKKYNLEFLKFTEKEIKNMQRILKSTSFYKLKTLYNNVHPAIKPLIQNNLLEPKDFISNWNKQIFPQNTNHPETLKHETSFGLKVRSKSEVLIAETLNNHNIPFFYEPAIHIRGYGIIHPDFLCLNPHTLNEIIWEHFGLLDSPNYANSTTEKMQFYIKNGYFLGKNLCISLESSIHPLTISQIDLIINNYLA